MSSKKDAYLKRVREALEKYGVLLESDSKLPSVAGLVAGEPIRGSWWGHPMSHAIYGVSVKLSENPDVIVSKLVSGKVTWVHRRLWSALTAIGSAGERWQKAGFTKEARTLLSMVSKQRELTADQAFCRAHKIKSAGAAIRELEKRLLVYAEEIHTGSGAHAKHVETWDRWCERVGFVPDAMSPAQAKRNLEVIIATLNARFEANAKLPWPTARA
jgi:hypothetical protein